MSEDPTREFDEMCDLRYVQHYMAYAQNNALDNDALEQRTGQQVLALLCAALDILDGVRLGGTRPADSAVR